MENCQFHFFITWLFLSEQIGTFWADGQIALAEACWSHRDWSLDGWMLQTVCLWQIHASSFGSVECLKETKSERFSGQLSWAKLRFCTMQREKTICNRSWKTGELRPVESQGNAGICRLMCWSEALPPFSGCCIIQPFHRKLTALFFHNTLSNLHSWWPWFPGFWGTRVLLWKAMRKAAREH